MRALVLLLALAACQAPAPVQAPVQPYDLALSTYKLEMTAFVELPTGDVIPVGGSATAWVVSTDQWRSHLVTAGHACFDKTMAIEGLLLNVTAEYALVSRDGERFPAEMVKRSDDPDLCLLVSAPLGTPLQLAGRELEYDEPVMYVGAPSGVFGDGVAPMFRGHSAGPGMLSIPTAPGASGSAIWSRDGVAGVLVTVHRQFHHLVGIVSHEDLAAFLR